MFICKFLQERRILNLKEQYREYTRHIRVKRNEIF